MVLDTNVLVSALLFEAGRLAYPKFRLDPLRLCAAGPAGSGVLQLQTAETFHRGGCRRELSLTSPPL